MSFLDMLRQFFTGSTRFLNLYESIVPLSIEICDTNIIQLLDRLEGNEPNIGLDTMGSVVEIDPLASPSNLFSTKKEIQHLN